MCKHVRLGGVLITDKPISLCVVFYFCSFLGEGRGDLMIRGGWRGGRGETDRKDVPSFFFFSSHRSGPQETDRHGQSNR